MMMKRLRSIILQGVWLTVNLIVWNSAILIAQNKTVSLQKFSIKNKILENNLQEFFNKTNAKIVEVKIIRDGKGYIYKINEIFHRDKLEDYHVFSWGTWKNHLLLFRGDFSADQIFTISDTATISNFLIYVHSFLPCIDQFYYQGKIFILRIGTIYCQNLVWKFKTVGDIEEWFTDGSYDSRDISNDASLK